MKGNWLEFLQFCMLHYLIKELRAYKVIELEYCVSMELVCIRKFNFTRLRD